MEHLHPPKFLAADNILDHGSLSGLKLYLYRFNAIPSIYTIDHIDGKAAAAAFVTHFKSQVEAVYELRTYNRRHREYNLDGSMVVVNNRCIVVLDPWSCAIYHDGTATDFLALCTPFLLRFREKARRKPLEINLIVANTSGLELRAMEVKRTRLDLGLFYEDDFPAVHAIIHQRLNQKNDKGIVLLHGLPGTGKTTYLRYLIGKIRKRVLFLSPGMAASIMNPEFIDLLVKHPNTVVIIEDAEGIITDRRTSGNSAVSNLLNISDGLLADFLNVQLVCTFNSALTTVDSALLRKGRLIAKYEFGKLGVAKAQRLSDHLGFKHKVGHPMTVAEISHQADRGFDEKPVQAIGFQSSSWKN